MSDLRGGSTVGGNIIYHDGNREYHAGRDTIERYIYGNVSVCELMWYRVPRACKIAEIQASLSTLPTGSNFVCDVRKNGAAATDSVTISDAGIVIGTGATAINGVYFTKGSVDPAVSDLVEGDVLNFFITSVGSGSPGAFFQLLVRLV